MPAADTTRKPNLGSDATTPFDDGAIGSPAIINHAAADPAPAGLRVRVVPQYLTEHSDPSIGKYVFGYRVRISNNGQTGVTLVSRRWTIVDADAERHEVTGEGVIGQQPRLAPGQSFDYASHCPLSTPWGTMEGAYQMQRDDGTLFTATIARFFLVSPQGSKAAGAGFTADP